ncbi:DUF7133 domain-containing protein [Algoriphagus machipongonensis]|uniref:Probable Cytochrome c subunit of Cbb3 type cytochrome oxidase n=1 Tax=Algoriphagus machipongonensis TaxID=388413 RepID=A3I2R3_9BACT|nr:c-type cytochrome [Algoriphagus machipongonensis]EAZ79367.1 probable Cytochrome c subunit of Cbb3 type cytochrome oxidase [Algoriphagus machipongonensis]
MRLISPLLSLIISCIIFSSCGTSSSEDEANPSPAQSAEEEYESFQIEPGFKLQLVAKEPMVQDPVYFLFDEDARLWVVEMRGFMTDTLGSEEELPIGRISILEDENGDGEMDKSTIYLDNLIMPRAMAFFKDGVLVSENSSLWITQDLDGDLKADTKVLLDSTYAASGNPEHSDNGLLRNLDNWYYNAKSRIRYKYQNEEWIRDSTEFRGQWGISNDDEGRLYYNYNWSQLHADLVPPNYLSRNPNHKPSIGLDYGVAAERTVYPIRATPAVNRGYIPGVLNEESRLVEFTAACAPLIYRGDAFPNEFYGNAFVAEPAGNLVKRNVVSESANILEGHDPHPGKEFLASTDERFRPVHLSNGPDGALYIADMYRGLIQHGEYLTPYLREQTIGRGLILPVHLGRIWKVVPEDFDPSKTPKLSEASNEELIGYLSSENAWYRETAQRLLVEKEDASIQILLTQLLIDPQGDELAKLHALWTLEGLGLIDAELLYSLLNDSSILIRNSSLRLLEGFADDSNQVRNSLSKYVANWSIDASVKEALQIALSSYVLTPQEQNVVLKNLLDKFGSDALIRDAMMSSLNGREFQFLSTLWEAPNWQERDPMKEIFLEALTSAIVKNGDKKEVSELLSKADTPGEEFNWKQKILISGIAIQAGTLKDRDPIALTSEPSLFKRNDLPIGESRAEQMKNMFSWPGFTPSKELAQNSQLDDRALKQFAEGRQKFLVTCAGCHGSDGVGVPRMGPPLANSEWVLGDERRLSMILLHGIEGAINVDGKLYDAPDILPVMPSHSTMDDASIAAILTYIRNEWGNEATPISGRTVSKMRLTTQGRVYPWSPEELNEHMEALDPE